jgi:predicted ribosomally synthesized peptide with SipW-like signal peptide
MKKRTIMIGSAILLAVLLVAGGTMAWFTASTDPVGNVFTAGTVAIELTDNFEGAPNVNPGDCYEKEVYVTNTGTKRALVRIKKDMVFKNVNEEDLAMDVVEYMLGENWTYEEDGYFYYNQVLAPETDQSPAGMTTPLFKDNKICFDGEDMDNSYQGAQFTITVKAEAIQATNGAPTDSEWAIDPLAPEVE